MAELEDVMEEYFNMFGDCFPTIPLAWGRSKEELKAMVERCINEKKDAYDIGFLKLGEVEY